MNIPCNITMCDNNTGFSHACAFGIDAKLIRQAKSGKDICPYIKENLDKRICDCEPEATNTETYREFIVNGYQSIGCDLTEEQVQHLDKATNEELNDIVEELDWLLEK